MWFKNKGGICVVVSNKPFCACPITFSGTNCQIGPTKSVTTTTSTTTSTATNSCTGIICQNVNL
jgi:hypothetical protein